jgi:hypothetical protein
VPLRGRWLVRLSPLAAARSALNKRDDSNRTQQLATRCGLACRRSSSSKYYSFWIHLGRNSRSRARFVPAPRRGVDPIRWGGFLTRFALALVSPFTVWVRWDVVVPSLVRDSWVCVCSFARDRRSSERLWPLLPVRCEQRRRMNQALLPLRSQRGQAGYLSLLSRRLGRPPSSFSPCFQGEEWRSYIRAVNL